MSALRDLAVYIRRLTPQSPELQNAQSMRQLLQHLKQKAVLAIEEDNALREVTPRFRTGGSDTPSLPQVIYRLNTAPDPDEYYTSAPDGLTATQIVNALNALPPS